MSNFFRRKRHETSLDRELRFHLEEQVRANLAAGMGPEEARREAALEFGGLEQIKDECRDERPGQWLEIVLRDADFCLRQLLAHRGFTAVALFTLALAIGANTTAFTVLYRLSLKPLPFKDPSRLVQVRAFSARAEIFGMAPADYFDERQQNTVFTDLAAYTTSAGSFASAGEAPVSIGEALMTDSFFPVVGVAPTLGRTPTPEESEEMSSVCMVSDWFWKKHLGASPDVLGRVIRISGRITTVIGVMPASLDDPAVFPNHPAIFYLDPVTHSRKERKVGWYSVLARLKPGVSLSQAQTAMTVVADRLAKDHPDTNQGRELRVLPLPTNQYGAEDGRMPWMVLALSGVVLLIACVNLANLQLVRATRRRHEIAIRLALGCSRRQLVGMFLLENLILAVAGGALGLVVAVWSNSYVASYLRMDMPLNRQAILYTVLICLLTAVACGILPAWLATRTAAGLGIRVSVRGSTADRSRHWLRQTLVLSEITLTLTLLAGASFFVRGLYVLSHRNLGWDPANELIAVFALDQEHYGGPSNQAKTLAFAQQLVETIKVLPGVEEAAISVGSLTWANDVDRFRVEGRPAVQRGNEPEAGFLTVGPGWIKVFGVRLVAGRDFSAADRPGSPLVTIVDESMARALWPTESALGKRIANLERDKVEWSEVVGVVTDFRGGQEFLHPAMSPKRFLSPWAQDGSGSSWNVLSVRTSGSPEAIKLSVQKAMGIILPDVALTYLATADEDLAATYSNIAFLRRILVQIASLGLIIAVIGIYGVSAFVASERTKEIGIRMALGAQPKKILWLFVRTSLALALFGAGLGLVAAFGVLDVLSRTEPAIPGRDAATVVGVAVLLVAVALVAAGLPALRATRVSPMHALRVD